MAKRLAIIGAGPIGLEAAVAATERGYEIAIFEQGQVADSVQGWGHVQMFSPFVMNVSTLGTARLRKRGHILPTDIASLTGQAFVEQYLKPLADSLAVPVHVAAEVQAIARDGLRKMDEIGMPSRGETPFRLLIRENQRERFEKADLVFDCTGTFRTPNFLGNGGIPALGEEELGEQIFYGIPEARRFAGARTLVVGGGHSAATIVRDLAGVGAQLTWAVRKCVARPCAQIADDPLRDRERLSTEANRIATQIDFRSAASVYAIESNSSGFRVTLQRERIQEIINVDHVVSATGFRPDLSLGRELQLQTCWATEGTYKLAAALLGENAGDCLKVPGLGAETLLHPEPGFFTLGMKSYGRTPDFLIQTGLAQIQSVFQWLDRNQ